MGCGGSREGLPKEEKIKNIFTRLDVDSSGDISRQELLEWIQDERFLHNEKFTEGPLSAVSTKILGMLDKNSDGKISQEELEDYFKTLDDDTIDSLTKSLSNHEDGVRDEVVRRIYDALDTNGDGIIQKSELLDWLQKERAWREVRVGVSHDRYLDDSSRETIFRKIDLDASGTISFEELKRFFTAWSLREMRRFTQDLMLQADVKKATEEGKGEKVAELRNDQAFADQVQQASRVPRKISLAAEQSDSDGEHN